MFSGSLADVKQELLFLHFIYTGWRLSPDLCPMSCANGNCILQQLASPLTTPCVFIFQTLRDIMLYVAERDYFHFRFIFKNVRVQVSAKYITDLQTAV